MIRHTMWAQPWLAEIDALLGSIVSWVAELESQIVTEIILGNDGQGVHYNDQQKSVPIYKQNRTTRKPRELPVRYIIKRTAAYLYAAVPDHKHNDSSARAG